MVECTKDCKYKKLWEECQDKRQQEKNNELHKCNERQKVKDKKIRELNKKVLTLTIIATVAGTLIGKEALEFIGEWLGLLSDFDIGGGDTSMGVFPAPSTLAVFGLAYMIPTRRRK